MSNRTDIIAAVKDILDDTALFKKVYTEPTDIEKERSFPIAWIDLGAETILDGAISSTCYLRNVELEITIGTRHGSTDSNMNILIDTIFDTLKSQFTLGGTAINCSPMNVFTDRGYFHPYALATITYTVSTR